METLLIAAITGIIGGLTTWGGLRVELRYLRRDIDLAHQRIDEMQGRRGFAKQGQ